METVTGSKNIHFHLKTLSFFKKIKFNNLSMEEEPKSLRSCCSVPKYIQYKNINIFPAINVIFFVFFHKRLGGARQTFKSGCFSLF